MEKKDYSDMSVRAAALNYYDAHRKAAKAREAMARAKEEIEEAEEGMLSLRPYLEGSVQPICGSAHLPHMRVYAAGGDSVVVIYYHRDGGGREGGRIEIRRTVP